MSAEKIALSEMLIRAYGPDNMKVVLETLGEQIGIVDQLAKPFTLKDALVQCLFHEACGDCQKLAAAFEASEDPHAYYSTLTEISGLDEARQELDVLLNAQKSTRNSIVGEKKALSQQASVYEGKSRLRKFLISY
ncbi:MAG: hypothetical protein Q8P92_02975 [Candidatus Daviesbacteria bacterium]|nr:hypothetical protein [Candidatus Daviesbacteria bacterium]